MGILITFFLFFIIVAVADLVIFTYLHELGHKKALNKAGIDARIAWNLKANLKHLKPTALATCYFDEKKLKKLSFKQKKAVFLGGIKSDLLILVILSLVSLFLWFLLVFKTGLLISLLFVIITLNTLVVLLIFHLINNIFHKNRLISIKQSY